MVRISLFCLLQKRKWFCNEKQFLLLYIKRIKLLVCKHADREVAMQVARFF